MSARSARLPSPASVQGVAAALQGALVAVLALLLVASALALVISQYRTRQLFAEIELGQQETKTLTAEGARLRADLGHAAQPAMVEAVARRLGMRPIDPGKVVMLPKADSHDVALHPAVGGGDGGGQSTRDGTRDGAGDSHRDSNRGNSGDSNRDGTRNGAPPGGGLQ